MVRKLAVVGECMLELTQKSLDANESKLNMALSYGGDTLNCAVYLARLGVDVNYITALGDDAMSAWLVDQ